MSGKLQKMYGNRIFVFSSIKMNGIFCNGITKNLAINYMIYSPTEYMCAHVYMYVDIHV